MPLTKKGSKILRSMRKTYKSAKKARSVFYAARNAGRLRGVDRRRAGARRPSRRR